jgi:hypothetical protein
MIARRGLLAGDTALAAVSPIGVTALPERTDLRFDVM